MENFLTYKDIILVPPFPAIISVLLILGFKFITRIIVKFLFKKETTIIEYCALFIITLSIFSSLIHVFVSILGINLLILRGIAWIICILGVLEITYLFRFDLIKKVRIFTDYFNKSNISKKITIFFLLLIILCFALTSLAPPTDADSLGYHLGVPLDFIRNAQISPRFDWLTLRLIGLGEILNMFGLAAGTDNFGSVLQFCGLIIVLVSLLQFVKEEHEKLFLSMLILGCPVLLFLVPNQKPQMLPAASITIALVMVIKEIIIRKNKNIDFRTVIFIVGSVTFAMACKYLFLVSGTVILILLLFSLIKSKLFLKSIGVLLFFYLLILFPMQLQKFLFYGDPISPMLESFFGSKEPYISNFVKMLKGYKDYRVFFPLNFIFPTSLGQISTILGTGVLSFIFLIKKMNKEKVLFLLSLLTISFSLFLSGARVSRYFIEPYFWLALIVANTPFTQIKKIFSKLLLLQVMGLAFVIGFGAIRLFPGALAPSLRNYVLRENANNFTIMEWLDKKLPKKSTILTTFRSTYFYPRNFMSRDPIFFSEDIEEPATRKKILSLMREKNVSTIVTKKGEQEKIINGLQLKNIEYLSESLSFHKGVRNPFNKGPIFSVAVFRFSLPYN